ncbi:NUDIX domain-containing protein [Roseovarius sp. D22-M7]
MFVQELLLLCHGDTKADKDAGDLERGLKSRSKRQAQKLGSWLQVNGLEPDITLASPADCARVSAEKALKAGGGTARDIVTDARLHRAPVVDHISALSERAGPRVLCSGHTDTLTDLLRHFAPDAPPLRPGMLAQLRLREGALQAGTGRLQRMVAADDLPDGFPYPGPGGSERRPRPAYYYTQSAALPYRHHKGAVEVLMVTSSSGRTWGIPKGICEPGLTPQESAAKEALEEAGVIGRIREACIGRYDHAKWGATCAVTVYPMSVTKILSGKEWDESHRKRKWVSSKEASARVAHPDLARIIAAFTGR